jgi:hypothetical protein
LSRLLVPRMLAAGSLVTSATAFRVGVGCLELWLERSPALVRHAVKASAAGEGAGRAQAAFRDDLLALARDSAEVAWREMRRGVDDLDAFTRPDGEPGERPHRPYRAKP